MRRNRRTGVYVEEDSESENNPQTAESPDSGLFGDDTLLPPTPEKDRLRTPKRKRGSHPPLPATPVRQPDTPDTPATPSADPESGLSFGLWDETLLPSTQKEHRLKTPKQKRTPVAQRTSATAAAAAAGTRSVDRPLTARRRSGKKALLPLKKRMECGPGEVSLWDLAMAKNKNLAKWIEERAELDRQLDTAELSVALDETFPDRMNTTI